MRAHGSTEATLWVLETNQRARFYEARGWKLNGGRKTDSRPGITFHDVRHRRRPPHTRPRRDPPHPPGSILARVNVTHGSPAHRVERPAVRLATD